jgi:hypothetical protein
MPRTHKNVIRDPQITQDAKTQVRILWDLQWAHKSMKNSVSTFCAPDALEQHA